VKVTVDVEAQGIADARRELLDAAARDRATGQATQTRAALLAAVSAVAIVLASGLAAVWIDGHWTLGGTERDVLRALTAVAGLLFLLAAVLGVVAAWPATRRADLAELVAGGDDARAQRRALHATADYAEREHARTEASGRGLRAAAIAFVLGLVVVLAQGVLFAFAANNSDARPPDDPPPGRAMAKLARDHAPLVWLHDRERFGPLDPAMFLARAELRWRRRAARRPRVLAAGRVRAARLGERCAIVARCARFGPYLPFQLTRPFQRGRERPRRLALRNGFYLDAPNRLRTGQLVPDPPVPIFFDVRAKKGKARPLRITYWLFFGFQRPLGRPARPGREGDWQRFAIEFDDKRAPTRVILPARGGSRRLAWPAVSKFHDTTHPVVYAALQSHELHATRRPSRGLQDRGLCARRPPSAVCPLQLRNEGLRWRTWAPPTRVQYVRAQRWYGFAGAWGRAGRNSATTGPLGPTARSPR